MAEKVDLARVRTVQSIIDNGLLPARKLTSKRLEHLASWTSDERMVYGRLLPFYPDNPALTEAQIIGGLTSGFESIFPVLAERPRFSDSLLFPDPTKIFPRVEELDDAGKKIVQDRMQSSMLVVCDAQVANRPDEMAATRVDPSAINDVVIPAPIWDSIDQNGLGETLTAFAQVHVIHDFMESAILFTRRVPFIVPDYESALMNIIEERKKDLWTHGVRLPIDDDFETGRIR